METELLDAIKHSQHQVTAQLTELSEALSQSSVKERKLLMAQWGERNDVSEVASVLLEASKVDDRDRASELLLDSLSYESIRDRQEAVAEAHVATFQWVFERQPTESVPWTDLVSWLSESDQQDSLYWITGKPGSGKSTLMKFLFENPLTKNFLESWAKPQQLITAAHFLWYSGEPIQKSQVGLLRSLLFQLLSQAPRLIECACSWRWRSYMSGALRLGSWTSQQLLKALKLALENLSATCKICMFIDGLDEYEGDSAAHSDLVKFIEGLSHFPSVKICVSSRPWVIFKRAFERGPSLQLHHLTQRDITSFVNQELLDTKLIKTLELEDRERCSELLVEIVEKADGVFLWVHLVVRDLLECLENGDGVQDLRRKLDAMPPDLYGFFNSMLDRLEDFYFEQAYRLFKVAVTAGNPLSLLTYSYVLEGDDFDPISTGVDFMTKSQLSSRCKVMESRLNSRCRGLLEVKASSLRDVNILDQVDFLHRTVRDFFESGTLENMAHKIKASTRYTKSFDVDEVLAGSFLAQLKSMDFISQPLRHRKYIMRQIFKCAERYERNNNGTLVDILNNLDDTGKELFALDLGPKPIMHWMSYIGGIRSGHLFDEKDDTFLSVALRHYLPKYSRIKLLECPSAIKEKSGRPLLGYVLHQDSTIAPHGFPVKVDIQNLELLLRNGADPNQKWDKTRGTVWECWLEYISQYHEGSPSAHPELVQATRLLAAYGAQTELYDAETIRSAFGDELVRELKEMYKQSKRRKFLKRVTHFSGWHK